ncbi:MAG: hypothetical protein Q4F95_13015 [Oscillospiraceae bacterium]|nr:hypothetical protein [Oscillospiraceae bacterium]
MKFKHKQKSRETSNKQLAADVIRSLSPQLKEEVLSYLSDEERRLLTAYADDSGSGKGISDKEANDFYSKIAAEKNNRSSENSIDTDAGSDEKQYCEFLEKVNNEQLFRFIRNEHPQIKALILSAISESKAADIMLKFNKDVQKDILKRIENMDDVSRDDKQIIYKYFKARIAL